MQNGDFKMEKLLYGAAYYDEYMPYERLDKDIEMMTRAGINVVRIGESTWGTFEPHDGVFDFSHLTKVIEAMGKAGISVIVGTPTYAIPTWMAKAHPEVIAETSHGRGMYGPRQNMDITNKDYLFYAERAIRKMMEKCLPYENVIGVQIDNETKAYDTAGANVQEGFVKYLKDKFNDNLDDMNAEFGLDYWSNRINSWEDFPDVRGTINGSLGGEFKKYQRKLAADFLMWQHDLVCEYKREDQFITHNTDFDWRGYSWGINPEVNTYEDAKAMSIVGVDIYHPSQDQLTGVEISFGGDVTRSLKNDNYLVLETEAQGFPQWLTYDGQLRLQAYSHLASGANMVEYWHWHSLHNGCETYWKGVLSHDFKENRAYRDCKVIGNEWANIGSHLINLKKKNHCAILVSNESLTALNWFPISENMKYNDVLMKVYRAMYEMGLECDFIWPENAAKKLSEYDLVVIPALYAASQELISSIREYVAEGGNIVASFKSFFADENVKVFSDETPHYMADVFGMSYSEFTYPDNVGLISGYGDLKCDGENAQEFMELLQPIDATSLIKYDHPSWRKYSAVTTNKYINGTAVYIGCDVSDKLLRRIFRMVAGELHIARSSDGALAGGVTVTDNHGFSELIKAIHDSPVIVKKGINDFGKEIVYYLNYSGKTASFIYEGTAGTDLLTGKEYSDMEKMELKPWNLAIVER